MERLGAFTVCSTDRRHLGIFSGNAVFIQAHRVPIDRTRKGQGPDRLTPASSIITWRHKVACLTCLDTRLAIITVGI